MVSMHNISIYTLLVLVFLGLSKSFSKAERSTPFIKNERDFASIFTDSPISVIFYDSMQAGLIIKTNFHRYRVVHAFKKPMLTTVRVSDSFYEKTKPYLGLTLFSRDDDAGEISVTPLPPGGLFIGNTAYGHWHMDDSGERIWEFHRAYRHFYDLFGWGDFRPSIDFYERMKLSNLSGEPFMGVHGEFGTEGSISTSEFHFGRDENRPIIETTTLHLKNLLKNPFRRI